MNISTGGVRNRRVNAMHRLEAQLKAGVKSNKGVDTPLTDVDVKRIESEISILKTKTVG